jgi:hypothetical protein
MEIYILGVELPNMIELKVVSIIGIFLIPNLSQPNPNLSQLTTQNIFSIGGMGSSTAVLSTGEKKFGFVTLLKIFNPKPDTI